MQIGRKGESKGNGDTPTSTWRRTRSFTRRPTSSSSPTATANKRIIVFDADTGAFKRIGRVRKPPSDAKMSRPKVPEDSRIPAKERNGAGPDQFDPPVHAARVSSDDLVYVSDRGGKRVQVFTLEGKFVAQVFVDRWCEAPHCGNGQTVASTAFSHDREQRFLYVASRSPARIWVLDRKTLSPRLVRPARRGTRRVLRAPPHEHGLKGNLYTTEVQDGKRAQKFVFMGMEKK